MAKLSRRRLLMIRGAVLGAVLGVICQLLPHDYRAACSALAKAIAATCGGV